MQLAGYFLALATLVSAFDLPSKEIRSRNPVVPAISLEERIRKAGDAEQFPFHAFILRSSNRNESSWCSGSLIGNEWVLTAAHCLDDAKEVSVYLGASRSGSAEIIYQITSKNFIIHSDWSPDTFKNDISLIKIPYTHFSSKVQAVKLPNAAGFYNTYLGDEVITFGWCHLSDSSGIVAMNLPYIQMSVIPNSQCRKYYSLSVSSSIICIAFHGATSSCITDLGSPAVLKTTKTQIGLTTFRFRTVDEKNTPAVFTSVSYYLHWIQQNSHISV